MTGEMQQDVMALMKIYQKAPLVPCGNCGRCCVSPHFSFIELLPLLVRMEEVFSEQELRQLVSSKPVVSDFHMSNIVCPLLRDNHCSCYDVRPLSCRLEGIDILDELTHRQRICNHQQGAVAKDDFGGSEIEYLLEEATKLNSKYCGVMEEPYYFDSVNLHCWFAVMFDKDIRQEFFLDLREKIFAGVDLRYLADSYVNYTKLNEKLELIDRFFELNNQQKAEEAFECIRKVNEDFVYTGAYFYPQSNVYINFMRDLLKKIDSEG